MSPFIMIGVLSGLLSGGGTYLIMHLSDTARPRRWTWLPAMLILWYCIIFIGGVFGFLFGIYFTSLFFINYSLYAPLEGAYSAVIGGVASCMLTGGSYAARALTRAS